MLNIDEYRTWSYVIVCDMAPSCIWHYLWNNCYVPFLSHPNFSFSCFPGHSGIQSFFESQPTKWTSELSRCLIPTTTTPPTTTTLLVKHLHQIHNQIISEPYKIIVPSDKSVALYHFFSHCNNFSLVTAWNRSFGNEPTPSTSSTAGATRDNFTAAVAARKAEETWVAIMVKGTKGGVRKWNTKRKDNEVIYLLLKVRDPWDCGKKKVYYFYA